MALIKCEECGKEISNRAKACIHCGCPIEVIEEIKNEKKEKVEKKEKIENKTTKKTTKKETVNSGLSEKYDKNKHKLIVEFDAIVSDKKKESTINTVSVKELGKTIEFCVPNDIKVKEEIWKKIDDEKCSIVVFVVKSVTVDPNAQSIVVEKEKNKLKKENNTVQDYIKNYRPNAFIRFFDGAGSSKVISIFVVAGIFCYYEVKEVVVLITFLVMCLPLLLLGQICPFLSVIRYIKKHHIDTEIKNGVDRNEIAVLTYRLLPTRKMLWYIKHINKEVGLELERKVRKNMV